MLNKFIDWIFYLLNELSKIGDWLFTPITLGATAEDQGIQNISTDGILLDSSSFSVKTYNFFVRLFTWNWDFSVPPDPITFTPIFLIGATFITALFIALFVKVWIRR